MVRTALLTLWVLALSAPVALAAPGHDGGEGTWGPANDKVVTNAGFILIIGFPLLVLLPVDRLQQAREPQAAPARSREGAQRARRPPRRLVIRYERRGPAALVTIDRPERHNAIDGATATALLEAFNTLQATTTPTSSSSPARAERPSAPERT